MLASTDMRYEVATIHKHQHVIVHPQLWADHELQQYKYHFTLWLALSLKNVWIVVVVLARQCETQMRAVGGGDCHFQPNMKKRDMLTSVSSCEQGRQLRFWRRFLVNFYGRFARQWIDTHSVARSVPSVPSVCCGTSIDTCYLTFERVRYGRTAS